jgi:hypothetical protein
MHYHNKNNWQLVYTENNRQRPLRLFPSELRAWLVVAALLLTSLILLATARYLVGELTFAPVHESPDDARLRRYQSQLNTIKENMAAVVSDSMETRMRRLEQSVAAGTVGGPEIQALEDLSRDLHVLEKYTSGNNGNVMDAERLMHPRFRTQAAAALPGVGFDAGSDTLRELVRVKHLLFLSVASCSMVLALAGGYWWRNIIHTRRLTASIQQYPALPENNDLG